MSMRHSFLHPSACVLAGALSVLWIPDLRTTDAGSVKDGEPALGTRPGAGSGEAGAAAARPPNVIFILADDLGWGDVGCYGQRVLKTPRIDRMAAEGARFTSFYAGSTVCAPSRCVLMTGYHTGHAYIRGNGRENLRPEDVTVAEVLKRAGYATGCFGKWGLGHEGSRGLPAHQGFDEFYGYLDHGHAHNYFPSFLVRGEGRVRLENIVPGELESGAGVAREKKQYSHDLVTEEALGFIDRHRAGPFFLYLPFTIPHANNEAKQEGMEVPDLGEFRSRDWPEPEKGFAAMLARLDASVGRVLDRLAEHGIDRDTLVIFSSDNGPHKEGGHDPTYFASSGPFRGFKRSLHEGGIRVPFIARWPGTIAAGTTSDHVAAFEDVMPTLAELAGVRAAVLADSDGISFAPALLGRSDGTGEQKRHGHLFWAFFEQGAGRAVRFGDWKAIEQPLHTPVRLYDLKRDPGEEKDVAADYPAEVARARELFEKSYTPSDRWKFPVPVPAKR